MGNRQSCSIAIRIDGLQNVHEADSEITGRVYFNATNKIDLKKLQGINLLLQGQEQTEISTTARHQRDDGCNQWHKAHNKKKHKIKLLLKNLVDELTEEPRTPSIERATETFVSSEYRVATFGGQLRPGQYEYPFRWRLPADLPSSMNFTDSGRGEKSSAHIRYTITAYLINFQGSPLHDGDQTQASTVVNVSARPTISLMSRQSLVMESEVFPVSSWCFWNRGQIHLGWESASTVVASNTMLSVRVFGDNRSQLEVIKLRVRLVETITFSTNGTTIKQASQTLVESELPVSGVAWWQPYYNPRSGAGKRNSDETLLSNQHNLVEGFIPPYARDTHHGRLIQVRHLVVVSAETADGWSNSTPESSGQIQLVRSIGVCPSEAISLQYPMQHSLETPILIEAEAWNPVVADSVEVLPVASAVVIDEGTNRSLLSTPLSPTQTTMMPTAPVEPIESHDHNSWLFRSQCPGKRLQA